MKVVTVVGARPQFIKAAAVSRALPGFNQGSGRRPIREILVHTGQHYDENMSAVFFHELGIPAPAYHLNVGSGPHEQQTGRMLERLEPVLAQERPDWVLVYGDTNSTLAGALTASKLGLPIAHVEAGLRSYNRAMPEENNRVVTDHLSSLLFCPTERSVKNLDGEGILKGVHLVGDVMHDSLLYHLDRADRCGEVLAMLGLRAGEYALATVHRAEITDRPEALKALFEALGAIGLSVVVPLHPRSKAVLQHNEMPRLSDSIRLIPPVSYHDMLMLERHARLILTDSGGVQKEAFWLHVPCVTLRDETEWVETLDEGWNRLAGTRPERIVAAARAVLEDGPRASSALPGDGHAAERILEVLVRLGDPIPVFRN